MNLFNISFLFLPCSLLSCIRRTPMRPHVMGHYGSASRLPQSRERPRPRRGNTATRRRLCLTVNGVVVGPPVLPHRPADLQEHPGCGHLRLPLAPALRYPVVGPGHRRVHTGDGCGRLRPSPTGARLSPPW